LDQAAGFAEQCVAFLVKVYALDDTLGCLCQALVIQFFGQVMKLVGRLDVMLGEIGEQALHRQGRIVAAVAVGVAVSVTVSMIVVVTMTVVVVVLAIVMIGMRVPEVMHFGILF
jgi:hypothetical protein